MLNRARLVQELAQVSQHLFQDNSSHVYEAYAIWQKISKDPTLQYKVREAKSPWLVPTWQGNLSDVTDIEPSSAYAVMAIDGSQIYPDRHQQAGCYLINIGAVQLCYGIDGKSIFFDSVPYVFSFTDDKETEFNTEYVNCKREELELAKAYDYGLQMKQALPEHHSAILLDGSLIFWHLEGKEEELKQQFVTRYCDTLEQFYKHNILVASYISFARSKELINLVRLALCEFDPSKKDISKSVERIVDPQLAYCFLKPHQRTTIFYNHASIVNLYPAHLRPCFFYLHVGHEIARIELPAWIAQDEATVNLLASMILDQAIKGRGYPVCLAEAHEQAVVKGPDREFFYHLLQRVGVEQKQQYITSQKSLKKRGIGI